MQDKVEKKAFRILVADDDELAREVISSLLLKEGYAVVQAVDGINAMRMLMVEEVNFVITDLRMPGADGIEVLKYAVKRDPEIAVVILTAYGTLDTTLDAMKEGAYDYLTKPFKGQEIIFVANRAYERAMLIKEKKELFSHLRETYRDMELLKTVIDSNNPEIITNWIERIEKLKTLNVLTAEDSEILKERLVRGR